MAQSARRLVGPLLALLLLAALAAAWEWTPLSSMTDVALLERVAAPYRSRWWALPALLLVFVIAELLLFPVLVLVFLCGALFGPWLGAAYGLLGSLAGSILPFLAGRRIGRERLARWGGPRIQRLMTLLSRRGVVAVFFARKVPLPFTVANLVCGACGVRLRDFLLGTLIGMGGIVILLTAFGAQVARAAVEPEPRQILIAAAILTAGITLSLLAQRLVGERPRECP